MKVSFQKFVKRVIMSRRGNRGGLLSGSTWDSIKRIIESEIENTRDRNEPSHSNYQSRRGAVRNDDVSWGSIRNRGRGRGAALNSRVGGRSFGNSYRSERADGYSGWNGTRGVAGRQLRGRCAIHGRCQVRCFFFYNIFDD